MFETYFNEDFLTFSQIPPKGWNSWDCFGASVTEEEVRQNAEFMAKHLKDYGWEYVIADIQWYEPSADSSVYHNFVPLCMDEYSRLIPAENRFPSSKGGKGFKPLADYIHGLGLKFGIHMMRGIPRQAAHQNTVIKGTSLRARDISCNNICPWNSDMYGVNMELAEGQCYYDSLFELYASWDVDFVKVDDTANSVLYGCHKSEIAAIRKAIDKTNRPIVLSLSPGPASVEHGAFLQKNANMWRLTDDFWDCWSQLLDMFGRLEKWAPYVRKGNWIDADMLPLGHIGIRSSDGGAGNRNTRFTKEEQRTLMTLWTIARSPLFFGGDLRDCDPFTLSLLTNKEVMAMHRDISCSRQVYRDRQMIIWEGISDRAVYYAFFNITDTKLRISLDGLKDICGVGEPMNYGNAVDLWAGVVSLQEMDLKSHDALLLKYERV